MDMETIRGKDLQLLMLVPLNGEIATSIVMVALIGMETVIPIMVMIYTEFQVNGLILMRRIRR